MSTSTPLYNQLLGLLSQHTQYRDMLSVGQIKLRVPKEDGKRIPDQRIEQIKHK